MAHVTDLGFTMSELGKAIDDGRVRKQSHPTKPLDILNYTEEVQFSKRWDKITLQTRGLIIHAVTGEIVARPWKKFFNFGERDLEIDFYAPVEVTDKMDGSLGILYFDGDDWAVATRGSFASDQAIHATKVFRERYRDMMIGENPPDWWFEHLNQFTLLFEIIYPDNRIVVNYGKMDDLVILGAVNKEFGHCFGPSAAAGIFTLVGAGAPPKTEEFPYKTFDKAIQASDREGKEGIVIRSGSKMVKLKQADYVELHRIVTNLSPKTIWQQIGDGKTISDICSQIPDEFHSYVEDIGRELLDEASEITEAVRLTFKTAALLGGETRADFARYVKKHVQTPYQKYMFLLLDNRPIDGVVWHSIKPRGDAPLVKESDDEQERIPR